MQKWTDYSKKLTYTNVQDTEKEVDANEDENQGSDLYFLLSEWKITRRKKKTQRGK